MTDILFDPAPIDPNLPRYDSLLHNLQGNILKGHGRDHAVLIFFAFNRPPEEVRPQLQKLLECVTSAADQLQQSQQFHDTQVSGGLFANFFLSCSGYAALGFEDTDIDAAFPFALAPFFRKGMRAIQNDVIMNLKDLPVDQWDEPYRGRIDAMLLLADDDAASLLAKEQDAIERIGYFGAIVTVELGAALRNENDVGVEHFGFADGRSQPIFFASDMAAEGATTTWNPAAELSLALFSDRTVTDEAAYGSFLVYRKLEQDVRGFVLREQELADEMQLQVADRDRAGAMAVGRFRDGTPLASSAAAGLLQTNDFDYSADPNAAKCPFHAHIRKTNPRGEATSLGDVEMQKNVRIVRRGIPYGTRNELPGPSADPAMLPSEGVGLLFMCFQRAIETQFQIIQQAWANTSGNPKGIGRDALIGQGSAVAQKWPAEYGNPDSQIEANFGGFVKMKGGEFFVAPSIPFLRRLEPPPSPH
jgi:Dyp-type peroxidase family